MVLVDREYIEAGKPIVMKWADSPFNTAADEPDSRYAFNPGWMQPTQVDNFYKRLEEKTSIIKDATFIKMESLQHNLEYLRNELWFDDVRYVSNLDDATGKVGSQIQDIYKFDESRPSFHRNSLNATNFVAYTLIPETFLKENIEKESFLPYIESDLGMRAGIEAERIGMFGIKNTARPHGRSGFDSMDGIFQQLQNINQTAVSGTDQPQGFGSPIKGKPGTVIPELQDKLQEYIDQNGRDEYSNFYVSRKLYNQILKEAAVRETSKGDSVFFDGSEVRIFGTTIKRVDFLNPLMDARKRNGWGHMALLCDPASLAWGFFNEVESKSTYEHDKLSYLTSIQCAFDTGIIWEEDVLAFEVSSEETGSYVATVTDADGKVNGAKLEVFETGDDTTALYNGTTDTNGVATIADIPYGKYDVKVTEAGHKTKTVKGVIINNATETGAIKLTKA